MEEPHTHAVHETPVNPELWTVQQAAEYWNVTPSRARAILSSRGITRVAGYPAAQVKRVILRQGHRTDLEPPVPDSATSEDEDS